MALKLFNTFVAPPWRSLCPSMRPVEKSECIAVGRRVHDSAHIGNFRTFVFADLVRRYLEFKGFAVNHVMNITDVEEQNHCSRQGGQKLPLREYTAKYEAAFLADLNALNCLPPHQTPRRPRNLSRRLFR